MQRGIHSLVSWFRPEVLGAEYYLLWAVGTAVCDTICEKHKENIAKQANIENPTQESRKQC